MDIDKVIQDLNCRFTFLCQSFISVVSSSVMMKILKGRIVYNDE